MYEHDFEVRMCELLHEDTNKKRRRNRAHAMLSLVMNPWQTTPGVVAVGSGVGGGMGTTTPASGGGGRGWQYRRLCLITTALAFLLGLLVGVMIPLCFLPRTISGNRLPQQQPKLPHRNSTVSWTQATVRHANQVNVSNESRTHMNVSGSGSVASLSNYTTLFRVPESVGLLETVQFPSVSFVSKTSVPMPPLLRQKLYGGRDYGQGTASTTVTSTRDAGLTSGVYWTQRVEDLLPRGFDDADSKTWRRFARRTPVVKVEEGCGRMQNRLLTYEDGTRSCCRYRQNTDQIQGELFSFYLGNVLRLRNLAPSSLALVKLDTPLFARVKPQLNLAQWNEDRAVVLTKFIDRLEPSYIPAGLRTPSRRLHPPDVPDDAPREDIIDLAQWSDLIVFDYLTANLDRLVNNLYNLQWNADMMNAPAHNLARDPTTGLLVFLDNESGLLHGYRLLEKYEHYHLALLDALCVFRRSTADVIKELHRTRNIGELLQAQFGEFDPEFREVLPALPEKSVKILNERIDRVYDQITMCERQYTNRAA